MQHAEARTRSTSALTTIPKRILVATDFSETADHALDYAIELAARIGATVTVLHAYELPVVCFPDGAFIASADLSTRIAEAAQSGLDATTRTREGRGVELTKVLKQAAPWEAVAQATNELGIDLVVCGTHARKGLVRTLLGSVAEKLVRTSPVPVLTIRAPEHAHAAP